MIKLAPKALRGRQRLSTGRGLIYAGVAAFVGVVVAVSIFAAGSFSVLEPESGTVTSPATVVVATGASGGHAVKFGPGVATPTPTPTPTATPAPTATPVPGGKPTALNTGVPAGTALTISTGDRTYSNDGQVISGLDIRGHVQITGKNITIKNSIIRGSTKACTNNAPLWVRDSAGASGFIFEDSEIAPTSPTACMDGVWAANTTILRANIHGAVDGVKAYDNVTIQDSFIHDLAYFASDPNQGGGPTHNDAIQTFSCNVNINVQHNNLDLSTTQNGNSDYQITQDGGTRCSNLVINNNWLDGGGCTINVAHKVLANLTGVSITNNRFGRHQGFANCTVLLSTQSTLTAYSGNVWDDTGQPIPAPQVHD